MKVLIIPSPHGAEVFYAQENRAYIILPGHFGQIYGIKPSLP